MAAVPLEDGPNLIANGSRYNALMTMGLMGCNLFRVGQSGLKLSKGTSLVRCRMDE
eukprot:CAMPEP_0181084272 /NCGR_PEP_ID=MMETSP1071-20121207/4606_1 /TAXON_ID=35127 /ORGANISM="Thalassiosira sp., Strain NH16" /LENGTH=55 /DNA_ID=CAMNT_0023165993 /DNA_START=14 /DNA_END=181 /DNA_ORIENTATION=-